MEIRKTIKEKTIEFQEALESDLPRERLLEIYKELKELQYQLLELQIQHEQNMNIA